MNNMRMVVATALALSLLMVGASPALAATVSRADGQPMNPNGEPFSAIGSFLLNKGSVWQICSPTFVGTITPNGIVRITGVTFLQTGNCPLLYSTASTSTPWTGQFDSSTQLSINNASLNVMLLGSCGPSKVSLTWDNIASSIAFPNVTMLSPDCYAQGTLMTTPKLFVQ